MTHCLKLMLQYGIMQSTHLQAANLGAGHELFVEFFFADAVGYKDETVINTQCINLLNYS